KVIPGVKKDHVHPGANPGSEVDYQRVAHRRTDAEFITERVERPAHDFLGRSRLELLSGGGGQFSQRRPPVFRGSHLASIGNASDRRNPTRPTARQRRRPAKLPAWPRPARISAKDSMSNNPSDEVHIRRSLHEDADAPRIVDEAIAQFHARYG